MEKVEIISDKEFFFKDLIVFLLEKSSHLKRDYFIDNILNESSPLVDNFEYLMKYNKIPLENVFGSTYQSSFRSNDQIYAISHTIHFIEFENQKIYGHIEPSQYGDIINFSKGALVPVFYKIDQNSEYKIATFDIKFNISDDAS